MNMRKFHSSRGSSTTKNASASIVLLHELSTNFLEIDQMKSGRLLYEESTSGTSTKHALIKIENLYSWFGDQVFEFR